MIEIGRKYRVINSAAGNDGLIVTVVGYAGIACDLLRSSEKTDRWYVDVQLVTNKGNIVNHVGKNQLEPLNDGNELVSWESMASIWTPEFLHA